MMISIGIVKSSWMIIIMRKTIILKEIGKSRTHLHVKRSRLMKDTVVRMHKTKWDSVMMK